MRARQEGDVAGAADIHLEKRLGNAGITLRPLRTKINRAEWMESVRERTCAHLHIHANTTHPPTPQPPRHIYILSRVVVAACVRTSVGVDVAQHPVDARRLQLVFAAVA